ncbi:MAG: type II toxin-antitoxin system VapC family toxin [Anaerolineales bacterium]|jgi:predicted nucleic acid-binding protein|nr:type II toxin-antitoxin system VapC family toxin [Anaerolineales bacterium]
MIVVDTNIIGYLYLNSEHSEQVERLMRRDPEWAAPRLWRSEFQNVLAFYMRKKLLSLGDAQQVMTQAQALLESREYDVPSFSVLRLAAQSTCSAYDCEFVALAQELGVLMVTVDRQVLASFPETSVGLDVFLDRMDAW